MTDSLFWDDDPEYFYAYWDAKIEEEKHQAQINNINNFNLGQYFLLAMEQCLQFSKHPKNIYPKKPFDLGTKKELSQEQIDEIRKSRFKALEKILNR